MYKTQDSVKVPTMGVNATYAKNHKSVESFEIAILQTTCLISSFTILGYSNVSYKKRTGAKYQSVYKKLLGLRREIRVTHRKTKYL